MARKPWAGVVRVSHMGDRQAGAPNVHADREQLDDVRAHAERMGVPLATLPAELDVSGGLPLDARPSLKLAVQGVEAGTYGGIIVAYLSRLGRNVREQLAVWDRVEAAGGRIVVVRESIDTSTPSGRYVRTILLANAERELEEHKERFDQLREWATAAGIWQRRQTPLGYRRDSGTRRLAPDEDAGRVERAFRDRATGASMTEIARDLGMTPNGARRLLANRVYLGELRVGAYINADAHPPIVTEDEWLAVQRRRTPARPPRSNASVALLSGLVRCTSCGHVMCRANGGRGHRVYQCHRYHSAGECPRPAAITVDRIDAHVEGIALQELAKLSSRVRDANGHTDSARDRLREAEAELAAYLEGVTAAGLAPGEYAVGARLRRQAVEAARDDLSTFLTRIAAVVSGDPLTAWQEMTPDQRNRQLRSLLECVLVSPVGRGKRVSVDARVRALALGAGYIEPYRGGGRALPVKTVAFPALDHPAVLAARPTAAPGRSDA